MTKQTAVELLQKQLPGFYSVEQVINLINDIDEPVQSVTPSLQIGQLESLVELVEEKVMRRLDRTDPDQLVDYSSAEMQMDNNEVSLYDIEVNTADIAECCADVLREVLTDFFPVAEEWKTATA